MTNREIVALFKTMAIAYQMLNENRFKVIAYERASEAIALLTQEVSSLYEKDHLASLEGIGPTMREHLIELCQSGHVRHFEATLAKLPSQSFDLLEIPGIGPKKSLRLVRELHLEHSSDIVSDLLLCAQNHKIAVLEGFGEKSEADIIRSIEQYKKGNIKENRILLIDAEKIAHGFIDHLKRCHEVQIIQVLGSLRRRAATIGDIDIAVGTKKAEIVLDHLLTYPHQKLIERGPTGASVISVEGRQVDIRVIDPTQFGAMVQYFTGSKSHNIELRSYALKKGKSLNEYGIKNQKTNKIVNFSTEEAFYESLGLAWIPPELREGRGEVVSGIGGTTRNNLPRLVSCSDIAGDVHIHTNYDLDSSHDIGKQSLVEYLNKAEQKGYSYIGLSDHNPSIGNHSSDEIISILKRRKQYYEDIYYSYSKQKNIRVQIFLMLEIDITPSGELAMPLEAFDYLDAAIVSVHSSFQQSEKDCTERVIRALEAHPKVRIFGHPTGRLLLKRDGIALDWAKIFSVLVKRNIALEINASPSRLDISDGIAFEAKKAGIQMCINTDSHEIGQMDCMQYGVDVARRGWLEKQDIVNTLSYSEFKKWLIKAK